MVDSSFSVARSGDAGVASGADPDARIRVGAKGIVVRDGHVLLLRERRPDGSTFWTLPGGGVEAGESLSRGLRREFREELGSPAEVREPVGTCVYQHRTMPGTATVYTLFRCDLRSSPTPARSEGIVGHDWFSPDSIPAATLAPIGRSIRRSLG